MPIEEINENGDESSNLNPFQFVLYWGGVVTAAFVIFEPVFAAFTYIVYVFNGWSYPDIGGLTLICAILAISILGGAGEARDQKNGRSD